MCGGIREKNDFFVTCMGMLALRAVRVVSAFGCCGSVILSVSWVMLGVLGIAVHSLSLLDVVLHSRHKAGSRPETEHSRAAMARRAMGGWRWL